MADFGIGCGAGANEAPVPARQGGRIAAGAFSLLALAAVAAGDAAGTGAGSGAGAKAGSAQPRARAPETAGDPATYGTGRLWRISKPGRPDNYVLGTIHVPDPAVAEVPPAVLTILPRVRTLATELAPGTLADDGLPELEALANGVRLVDILGERAYGTLTSRLAGRLLPETAASRLKPWAALLRLTRPLDGEQIACLDENLFNLARAQGLRWFSVESVDEQAASFDAIPLATQVALLDHALADRGSLATRTRQAVHAWQRGDLAALRRAARGDGLDPGLARHYAELDRHIVRNRTAVMHYRLFMPFRSGRVLAAVGAQHLPGDDGLLALLRADGYAVSRLW